MRAWLVTSTAYGTWLLGDPRGFVGRIRDGSGRPEKNNAFGEPYDADLPPLARASRAALKSDPIKLTKAQAKVLLNQFRETAQLRCWALLAVAVMGNHFHAVVAAADDVPGVRILGDLKGYGSRALNGQWPKPVGRGWWTRSGSARPLRDLAAVEQAIEYVLRQEFPLVTWRGPSIEMD